ncbi:hypothetical protein QVD17_19622 [Tagetes erecta]|uniref:Uncharacterized protein n=1 Tax=Tagetes erecta TaxID=13708 RepID=A0AAD8KJS8_TARER|nr:hypothetical protein QVD17_19622 [Tagetes erecta]
MIAEHRRLPPVASSNSSYRLRGFLCIAIVAQNSLGYRLDYRLRSLISGVCGHLTGRFDYLFSRRCSWYQPFCRRLFSNTSPEYNDGYAGPDRQSMGGQTLEFDNA